MHNDVVYVHMCTMLQPCQLLVPEMLEHAGGIGEPKWHHLVLVEPLLATKSSKMLMLRSNLNLVVAMLQVQTGEDVAACQTIQRLIDAWQGVAVQTSVCIQRPIVNTKMRSTAFLPCKQHRVAIWGS